ncbi:hypothetical protein P171DRAFT_484072 [Karstenula rhodostoma CBS 690.94]|uniref:Uncharacterized protein n=1 Tax=Karstenula rhodostoma CBS 690.94 TaxID=1392251 RepID=A0A9P4PJW2_9PLEO|nr:hypothetical protein P171DRAFT_484072 [Karstenula rhodostoma CBS 690.94]
MEKSDNLGSVARDATAQEILELIHEPSDIPVTAWLLAFTGAAAQLARYGITVVWQNYLQNPRGDPQLPGALGLGSRKLFWLRLWAFIEDAVFVIISLAIRSRLQTRNMNPYVGVTQLERSATSDSRRSSENDICNVTHKVI